MKDSGSSAEERFVALLREYGTLLRSAIARACPRGLGLDIDDLEQDARVKLLHALRDEREIEHPASYLHRIAVTATLDAVRRAKARKEDARRGLEEGHELPAPGGSPEAEASRRELSRILEEELAKLPEARRRGVGLHLQGFSTAEIGELMGWSEPKARNLTYRGLAELRALLAARGVGNG